MGRLAALIQAGDANSSDFGRNPLWADVLVKCPDDEKALEACCDFSSHNSRMRLEAPVYKSKGKVRHFSYLHPASALRISRLAERLLPHFNVTALRFSDVCFSNQAQYKGKGVSKKGLFDRIGSWRSFISAHSRLLAYGPCMGVLDLREFFPSVTPDTVANNLSKFVPDYGLVDDCANFVEELGVGIPVGYAAGQIIAQLVLSPLDEYVQQWGLPCARYVDDGRISGKGQLDVARDMAIFYELAEEAGLKPNLDKTFNHLPRRAACIPLIGGCPQAINVEDYRLPDASPEALDRSAQVAEGDYVCGSNAMSGKGASQADEQSVFDVPGLFNDHICSQHLPKSDAVERYVARLMAKKHTAVFQIDELALARKRVGAERLYAGLVQAETALIVGKESAQGDKRAAPEDQHRAFTYLKRAIKDESIGPKAQGVLNEIYESGVPPHLELEFCAIAKERSHRYAAQIPLVRKGIESGWSDISVARLGALASLEKENRNRFLDMAEKISPATQVACRVLRESAA